MCRKGCICPVFLRVPRPGEESKNVRYEAVYKGTQAWEVDRQQQHKNTSLGVLLTESQPQSRSMTGNFYSVSSASLVEEGGVVEEEVRPADPKAASPEGGGWSSEVVGSDDGVDLARSSREPGGGAQHTPS